MVSHQNQNIYIFSFKLTKKRKEFYSGFFLLFEDSTILTMF